MLAIFPWIYLLGGYSQITTTLWVPDMNMAAITIHSLIIHPKLTMDGVTKCKTSLIMLVLLDNHTIKEAVSH